MSTEDPKGPEAPEHTVAEKDDEDDSEGHRFSALTSDPAPDIAKSDESDDTEGHYRV